MSLTDDLKRMKKKGRQVVSIDYVLRHLEESQKNDYPNCVGETTNVKEGA